MTVANPQFGSVGNARFWEIEPNELSQYAQNARIVDVREWSEFVGPLCHVPCAELVPLSSLMNTAAGWDRTQTVVVVCRSGRRSKQAAALLAASGFARVLDLRGGMEAYTAAGLSTECGPCHR